MGNCRINHFGVEFCSISFEIQRASYTGSHINYTYCVSMLPFIDAQSYLTLAAPMDCNLPCSSVYGICQARTLKWVADSSSRGSSWPKIRTCVSCISCIGRWILYHWVTCEALHLSICYHKFTLSDPFNPFIYVYYLSILEEFNSDSSLL